MLLRPPARCVLPQLVPKLSRNYLKEGYMEKTGPKVRVPPVQPGVCHGGSRAEVQ